MLALLGGAPKVPRLISAGILSAPLTLARAQDAASRSAALDADGVTWSKYAADIPRFNGAARRLLIEGARANGIRNPRGEGAGVGSDVLPTHWGSFVAGGLVRTIVAAGSAGGFDYIRLNLAGSATGGGTSLSFDTGGLAIAAGNQIATSAYYRLAAGSSAGLTSMNHRALVTGGSGTTSFNFLSMLSSAWVRGGGVVTAGAGATSATAAFSLGAPAATAVNITLDIAWPQIEVGAFASTPILPPAGTPGASSRGADLVSAALAALKLPASGAGTILWAGIVPRLPGAGVSAVLAQIGGADDANRASLRIDSAGQITASRTTASAALASAGAGTVAAGAALRAGLTLDGAGRVAGCIAGGAVQAVAGAPTSGLTTLRIGGGTGGADASFAEVGTLIVLPRALSDAALLARVAALPA